jgi:hypothetical protein
MSPDAKAASRFRSLLASERRSADPYEGLADASSGLDHYHACAWA